ncbi:putative receptor-type tyrosine-protein phosphatase S-like [Sesbania bispinosa]|nr:putative receptor-type tyrosine-protein phosphatase S-like [Sesbania bispinosa]
MRLLSPRRLSSSAHRPSPSPTLSVPLPPSLSVLLLVPPSFACAWLPEEGFRLPLLRHHLPPLAAAETQPSSFSFSISLHRFADAKELRAFNVLVLLPPSPAAAML